MFYNDSYIQINPDQSMLIQHANMDSLIQLVGDKMYINTKNEINIGAASTVNIIADEVKAAGNHTTKLGPGPYMHPVYAEVLFPLLISMATAIDTKLPVTPGVNVGLVEAAKEAATSTNVIIT